MLWPGFGRLSGGWDPGVELFRRQIKRVLEASGAHGAGEHPAVNVWSREADMLLTAEIPGVAPRDLDISVMGNTVTIRGKRHTSESVEGEAYHRRERGHGEFVRTLQLPHEVDPEKVKATYEKGTLHLILPRAEADKPKRIAVSSR